MTASTVLEYVAEEAPVWAARGAGVTGEATPSLPHKHTAIRGILVYRTFSAELPRPEPYIFL